MNIVVKCTINIFTVKDSKIYLLLKNGKPLNFNCNDCIDKEITKYLNNNITINNLNLNQCYTFSNKIEDKLELNILYTDIVNINDINLKENFNLVDIDSISKDSVLIKSIEYLKNKLVLYSYIKKLYPDEFVLPQIQKLYENLLGKCYDRRNFRKKLIKLDIIEDLNKMSSNKLGRPAKLYKFKNIKEDKILL